MDGQHPPGVLESLLSSRSNPGVPVFGVPGSTDLTDDAAHDLLQGPIHAVGVARGLGVGHGPLWHEAVLADDVDELRPVATIAQFTEQLTHLLIAVWQVDGLHGSGKGEVDLLDLVEEGDVVLRELEIVDVEIPHHLCTNDVEAGELPAPPGMSLIGDAPAVQPLRRRRIDAVEDVAVQAHGVDAGGGHGVLHDPTHLVRTELLRLLCGECCVQNEILTHELSL